MLKHSNNITFTCVRPTFTYGLQNHIGVQEFGKRSRTLCHTHACVLVNFCKLLLDGTSPANDGNTITISHTWYHTATLVTDFDEVALIRPAGVVGGKPLWEVCPYNASTSTDYIGDQA